jgi:hypothetical protein
MLLDEKAEGVGVSSHCPAYRRSVRHFHSAAFDGGAAVRLARSRGAAAGKRLQAIAYRLKNQRISERRSEMRSDVANGK